MNIETEVELLQGIDYVRALEDQHLLTASEARSVIGELIGKNPGSLVAFLWRVRLDTRPV